MNRFLRMISQTRFSWGVIRSLKGRLTRAAADPGSKSRNSVNLCARTKVHQLSVREDVSGFLLTFLFEIRVHHLVTLGVDLPLLKLYLERLL